MLAASASISTAQSLASAGQKAQEVYNVLDQVNTLKESLLPEQGDNMESSVVGRQVFMTRQGNTLLEAVAKLFTNDDFAQAVLSLSEKVAVQHWLTHLLIGCCVSPTKYYAISVTGKSLDQENLYEPSVLSALNACKLVSIGLPGEVSVAAWVAQVLINLIIHLKIDANPKTSDSIAALVSAITNEVTKYYTPRKRWWLSLRQSKIQKMEIDQLVEVCTKNHEFFTRLSITQRPFNWSAHYQQLVSFLVLISCQVKEKILQDYSGQAKLKIHQRAVPSSWRKEIKKYLDRNVTDLLFAFLDRYDELKALIESNKILLGQINELTGTSLIFYTTTLHELIDSLTDCVEKLESIASTYPQKFQSSWWWLNFIVDLATPLIAGMRECGLYNTELSCVVLGSIANVLKTFSSTHKDAEKTLTDLKKTNQVIYTINGFNDKIFQVDHPVMKAITHVFAEHSRVTIAQLVMDLREIVSTGLKYKSSETNDYFKKKIQFLLIKTAFNIAAQKYTRTIGKSELYKKLAGQKFSVSSNTGLIEDINQLIKQVDAIDSGALQQQTMNELQTNVQTQVALLIKIIKDDITSEDRQIRSSGFTFRFLVILARFGLLGLNTENNQPQEFNRVTKQQVDAHCLVGYQKNLFNRHNRQNAMIINTKLELTG